jgi:putative endonuclease
MFYVYILRCIDDTFYTGITNDLEKRLHHHNNTKSGARYTKTRRPVELIYAECCADKHDAILRELAIKRLPRKEKEKLFGK